MDGEKVPPSSLFISSLVSKETPLGLLVGRPLGRVTSKQKYMFFDSFIGYQSPFDHLTSNSRLSCFNKTNRSLDSFRWS